MNKKVGDRVRELRRAGNLSQDYVAGQLGIGQRALSKLENGKSRWDVERVVRTARVLGRHPSELLPFGASPAAQEKLIVQYEARVKELAEQNAHLKEEVHFLREERKAARRQRTGRAQKSK